MTRQVFLIRHGETEWNKTEVFRGRKDIPLNEHGVQQAKAAADYFAAEKIDALYTSPLSRASQTAAEIARHQNIPVTTERGFIDINCGLWEGKSLPQVMAEYPDIYETWEKSPHKARIPGGETLNAVRRRSMAALSSILEGRKGEKIFIISHRVIIKVPVLALMGLNNSHFWQIKLDTACSTTFEFKDGIREGTLLKLNNTSYLEALKKAGSSRDF